MKTIGTLFGGFGGVDIGAISAGLNIAWSIEYDPKIAAVARQNLGEHVIAANILDIDPTTLPAVDVLHASPPCPNFSQAKQGGTETAADIALANKLAQFIDALRPRIFTLENVAAYRRSASWSFIRERLYECGYWLDVAIVNAADFGVPQTRKRMIVRALRGSWVPMLPQPEPWIGWYAALYDLIPTLPDAKLANWQIKRLPEEIIGDFLIGGGNTSDAQAAPGVGCRNASDPAHCVTTSGSLSTRAWIINGTDAQGTTVPRAGEVPTFTVIASQHKGMPKALLPILIGNNANATSGTDIYVSALRPAQTVRTTTDGRAVLPGRIVKITPRCLARFQSFPDWYELPKNKTLALRGVGNAVPPLMYEKIIRQLAGYNRT